MRSARYISDEIILWLTMAFFPVLPVYFRITGSFMMYYAVLMLSMGLMIIKKKSVYNIFKLKSILIYVLLMFFLYIRHFDTTELMKFIIAPLGLFVLIITLVDTPKKFWICIDTLIIVSGIICLFGIVEAITRMNVFHILNNSGKVFEYTSMDYRMGLLRIAQSFTMATNYCNYLIFLTALTSYRLSTETCKRTRLYKIILVLQLINAFLTGSRGPLVVILVLQLILLHKSGKKERVVTYFKIGCLLVIACVAGAIIGIPIFSFVKDYFFVFLGLINKSFIAKVSDNFGSNLEMSADRVKLYGWVWDGVKHNLWTGIGSTARRNFTIQANQWRVKTSIENEYLSRLLEYGIIGLFAEVNFFTANLRIAFKGMKQNLIWEKIGFNTVCFYTLAGYFLNFFTVSMQADERIFQVVIGLLLTYNLKVRKYVEVE